MSGRRHLNHDQGIGGLHGEQEVVVVQVSTHIRELEGALHHSSGGVPVEAQDAGAEAAVVGAHPHRSVQPLALLHQRLELLRGHGCASLRQALGTVLEPTPRKLDPL